MLHVGFRIRSTQPSKDGVRPKLFLVGGPVKLDQHTIKLCLPHGVHTLDRRCNHVLEIRNRLEHPFAPVAALMMNAVIP